MAATTEDSRADDGSFVGPAPPAPNWFQRKAEGRPWLAPAAACGGLVLASAYVAWQDPNGDGVYMQCPTQSMFGIDCPGCGGLRATHALLYGRIADAFDHNVVVAVAVPIVAVALAVWLLRALWATWQARRARAAGEDGARPGKVAFPLRLPAGASPVWKVAMVGLLAFAVVRNIDAVPLFEYLHSDAS